MTNTPKIHFNYVMTSIINWITDGISDEPILNEVVDKLTTLEDKIRVVIQHIPDYLIRQQREALRDDIVNLVFMSYSLLFALRCKEHEVELGSADVDRLELMTNLTNWERIKCGLIKITSIDEIPSIAVSSSVIAATIDKLKTHINQSQTDKTTFSREYCILETKRILCNAYYLGYLCNYPLNNDYRALVTHRMSRFDLTRADAELTQKMYESLGIDTIIEPRAITIPYDLLFINKASTDQTDKNGKWYNKGEFLESVNTKEPLYIRLER